MKYQLYDDPSSHTITECSKQVLAQLLGAIAFSGSIAMGLVTFQWISQNPSLGTPPITILFALSLVGAAIALTVMSLSIWLVMANVKFIQERSRQATQESVAH